ncbi:MAG TPA: biotin--[acetyl-CoA-carboxylase] ligase [Acidimicrobiales bacterium]|nr:biotin--[acetyl-CoA-carboxylase] ligase [Acidimicrobiales bacterium]
MTWDVRRFDELDSTNTWIMAQARAGAAQGLVAVADHQTAGRGRLGRRWESPPGANLLCSVLLRPAALSHLVVVRMALAARDAVRAVAGLEVGLKWPNDLVTADGAKLAGLLAETDGAAVAAGIGLNVAWAPEGAACLGAEVDREAVLAALLEALGRWCDASDDDVARAYREACVTLNRQVRVELLDESFTGSAADIDADGHLLVDTGACLRTVTAGDVVLVRSGS